MALLRIKVRAKNLITWGNSSVSFIRDTNSIKDTAISYSGAVNLTLSAGQTLYSQGQQGSVGYLTISNKETTTLNGNGMLRLQIEHHPTATEGNKTITFNIDESPAQIHFTYNSNPNVSDVIVETQNRTPYAFRAEDFTAHYSDYDTDALAEIQINGSVDGIQLEGEQITSGEWIDFRNITDGLLTYHPQDRSDLYEIDLQWKAKDTQGNISIN